VNIDLKLNNPRFLFDRKDPTPIKDRDLNEDVVSYIINSLEEIPKKYSVQLNIFFEKKGPDDPSKEKIKSAIENFFNFEKFSKQMELKGRFERGFKGLFIGIFFLSLCIITSHYLKGVNFPLLGEFVTEGVTVLGWVSMWHPIQIFLYEWWPIKEEITIFDRASLMNVEINYEEQANTLLKVGM
jgi:hypothetical protein